MITDDEVTVTVSECVARPTALKLDPIAKLATSRAVVSASIDTFNDSRSNQVKPGDLGEHEEIPEEAIGITVAAAEVKTVKDIS